MDDASQTIYLTSMAGLVEAKGAEDDDDRIGSFVMAGIRALRCVEAAPPASQLSNKYGPGLQLPAIINQTLQHTS
jgi:hypothetical protein